MNVCEKILQRTKGSNTIWVEMQTEEQVACFRDWVLSVRPSSHTEFARMSSRPRTFLTWLDVQWGDDQGIIDRIGCEDTDIFVRQHCSFAEWYIAAYPDAETETVCDCSDLI